MIGMPPQNMQDANYTFAATDIGDTVLHTAAVAHTWTINSNAEPAAAGGLDDPAAQQERRLAR
jgi:hypothetical protein